MSDPPWRRMEPGADIGRFVILEEVGRGGMGVVYRARQKRPDRIVALKVIAPEYAADEEFRKRFERESTIAALIEHDNVITVYVVSDDDDDLLFIAMRFIDGMDLQQMIAKHGRLEPRRAAEITNEVAQALDATHRLGLVHRDIKPANILISRIDSRVYLTDFGLTRYAEGTDLTKLGAFVGTIDYVAPEQVRAEPVDARTDIYALGCVLFHTLSGTVPFPLENDAQKIYAHCDKPPPSIRERAPEVPPAFESVLMKAMSKKPNERYNSAGELGRAAIAAAGGLGRRPNRLARIAAVAIVVAVAVVAAVLATRGGGGGSTPREVPALPAIPSATALAPGPTVNIGAIYPLTSADGPASQDVLDGVRFARDYINSGNDPGSRLPLHGGGLPNLGGARLNVLPPVDLGNNRCLTKDKFNQLVHDHPDIAGVVGARDSTYTLQAITVADKLGVPLVNETSSASSLTLDGAPPHRTAGACNNTPDKSQPSFFRVGPSDRSAATDYFRLITEVQRSTNVPVRTVAMLYENSDIFGKDAFYSTEQAAAVFNPGITVKPYSYPSVLSAPLCTVVAALRTQLEGIKKYNPDVLFVASYAPDAVALVQTMQAIHYVPRALLTYGTGFAGPKFAPAVHTPSRVCGGLPRGDPSGLILRTEWASGIRDPSPAATRIEQLFQQRNGRPMTPNSAAGFTATMTLAEAINAAGLPVDRTKILNALRHVHDKADQTIMPWDGITFDGYGQNTKARTVFQQVVNGSRYVPIYPDSLATHTAIWPLADARGSESSWWIYVLGGVAVTALLAALGRLRRKLRR